MRFDTNRAKHSVMQKQHLEWIEIASSQASRNDEVLSLLVSGFSPFSHWQNATTEHMSLRAQRGSL